MKRLPKTLFILFSVVLFIYMLWPWGPKVVSDFKDLPDSAKSTLDGDTVQVPNVAGYFSENYRDFVVPYYVNEYQSLINFPFAPLRLVYPPEYAYTAIKEQTQSTYLEELVYPLRNSLFVNGMEPIGKDGEQLFAGAAEFGFEGNLYPTKTTIRFYPPTYFVRLLVWFGIVVSVYSLWKVGRRVLTNA
ncbi:hypothetical protein ACFL0F_00380 [Patescibacteria group bacterium]